jgi:hypothetical protein
MKFDVRVTGYKEIDQVFVGLPKQLSHKVLQAAHMAAAKPLIEAEKLGAPEGPTGNLVDSIGAIKTSIGRAHSLGEIQVGPRRGGRLKGHAGHLVEEGTKQRTNHSGANRGIMRATPFALPAWEKTKEVVLSMINTEIGRKLYAFMKRTIKNG